AKTEIIPNVVDVPSGSAAAEPGIVQAQHRVIDVAELFALEGGLATGLFHVQTEGPGDFKGQLGLAGAGLAGEQQRLFHGDGDIDDFPQLGREIITVGTCKLHPFNSIPNQVIHDGPRSRGGPAPHPKFYQICLPAATSRLRPENLGWIVQATPVNRFEDLSSPIPSFAEAPISLPWCTLKQPS